MPRMLPSKSLMISIHAPPRGATRRKARTAAPTRYFNSRPSARGDKIPGHNHRVTIPFQFTPLREGRHHQPISIISTISYFNSRPSARGDRPAPSADQHHQHFNSRPSARGDMTQATLYIGLNISIHAPPRGATVRHWRKNQRRLRDFNSRPSARGDGKRHAISANLLFNPYKSAWLNNSATQFVEIILVIFHRIIA